MSLTSLAKRLAGLGRREEALAAIQEVVGTYRELAAARPDAFRYELEQSSRAAARLEHGLRPQRMPPLRETKE